MRKIGDYVILLHSDAPFRVVGFYELRKVGVMLSLLSAEDEAISVHENHTLPTSERHFMTHNAAFLLRGGHRHE